MTSEIDVGLIQVLRSHPTTALFKFHRIPIEVDETLKGVMILHRGGGYHFIDTQEFIKLYIELRYRVEEWPAVKIVMRHEDLQQLMHEQSRVGNIGLEMINE